jgi:cytochrome c553
MKYTLLLSVLFLSSTFIPCHAQETQNATEYNMAAHVSDENKKIFIERAEKGKILYKIHCSECHGIFSQGKDSIPNFTKQQIDNYHARSIVQLKTHSTVRNLSPEQLDYVLTFLRLRKIDK